MYQHIFEFSFTIEYTKAILVNTLVIITVLITVFTYKLLY